MKYHTILPILMASSLLTPLALATDTLTSTVFKKRPIPDGVALKGHGKHAKVYGYRIPSLLTTQKGTILAFAERRLGLHDHAQNDIVLKRSTDQGKTWSDEIVVFEDDMNSINDPLSVQLENGRILLMCARFPYGRHARDSGWIKRADLGFSDKKKHVLTYLIASDDDGKTWSKPIDFTRSLKHKHVINANTPGQMIQLTKGPHKGRIITPLWGTIPKPGKKREWCIWAVYSDDYGKTWKKTPPLKDTSGKGYPNECQVAQASNGDLILISRNQGGERFRKKAISKDGGNIWSTINIDPSLPSVACMGSIIKGPTKPDDSWDLYASFPSAQGRKNGQIAISTNHGQTFQIKKIIPGYFSYSCIQISPDRNNLFLFYEAKNMDLNFHTIPLSELR